MTGFDVRNKPSGPSAAPLSAGPLLKVQGLRDSTVRGQASQRPRRIRPADRERRIAVVFALALLLVAGCGGGGKTLAKTEWIARAEVICIRAADAFDELDPDRFSSQAEFARNVDELFDNYLGDLRELPPPSEDQATIEQWLDLESQLADSWAEFLQSDGRKAASQTFEKTAGRITGRADSLIRAFGASKCSND